MTRVLITGSTAGLGLLAAQHLLESGHEVVLHARNAARAGAFENNLASRSAGVVIGDLASAAETHGLAQQVNAIGGIDAVIHNAAVYAETSRSSTPDGHARTLAVNLLAPYMLTAWLEGPARLIYLSSSMHRSGDPSLQDIDWSQRKWDGVQAYSDSKLFLTALAFAVARHRPHLLATVVDPGWVPTRMGGAGAPDDLDQGYLTQTWLATSNDASATVSGAYWFHRKRQAPAPATQDPRFQDALLDELVRVTGVRLP